MEELDTEIKVLEGKKYDLQTKLAFPFRFGRSPSDQELLTLAETAYELQKVEYALDVLKDIKHSIALNGED